MATCSVPSPTLSGDSGSSTNPNTPQAEEPYDCQPVKDTQPSRLSTENNDKKALGTSSSGNREVLRFTNAKALALWQPDGRAERLFLNIYWNPRGDASGAFFKIHTRVQLDGAESTRRDAGVSIFMFIPPERIRHISFDAQPDQKPFGPNTVALTFNMIRPPALVLPKTLTATGRTVQHPTECFYTLAAQSCFLIYASIPERSLPAASIQQLCTAISWTHSSTEASLQKIISPKKMPTPVAWTNWRHSGLWSSRHPWDSGNLILGSLQPLLDISTLLLWFTICI